MESASRTKSKRKTILIASLIVAGIILISAISLAVWWHSTPSGPDLGVSVNYLYIYNETILPPLEGYVLIGLHIDLSNDEHESVPLDPSDFVLETIDGHMQHYAERISSHTIIMVYGEESNTSNQDRKLPSGGWGYLEIPFELPMNLTLRSITWQSTLGEITSYVHDYVNEPLLSYYDNRNPP